MFANLHLEITTWSLCVTLMYENEHDVTSTINEFANTSSPVKIRSFNDKHACLGNAPITCSGLSKLEFQLFLQLLWLLKLQQLVVFGHIVILHYQEYIYPIYKKYCLFLTDQILCSERWILDLSCSQDLRLSALSLWSHKNPQMWVFTQVISKWFFSEMPTLE